MNKPDQNSKPAFSGERIPFASAFKEASRSVARINQKDYLNEGLHPIIDQGQPLVGGYSDGEEGLFTDVPAIVFGDHTRCVKYIEEPFFAGADGVKILKPALPGNDRYWYHALRNVRVENLGYSRHFKLLRKVSFPVHSASRQTEICTVLDKSLNLIECRKKTFSYLQSLVKSRFVEMFGDLGSNINKWEKMQFETFAAIDTQMTNDFERYANAPHIGIDCIENGTGKIFGYKTVSEDNVRSGKYLFTPRHIIYSKIRPALNKVALPNFSGVCSADAYPILPNQENCDRIFLAHAMRSNYFLDYILPLSTRAQIPKVNKDALRGFAMPLPPLPLQREFAAFAGRAAKLEFVARQQIEKLQTLYDSLAQEYFG